MAARAVPMTGHCDKCVPPCLRWLSEKKDPPEKLALAEK
jgi:hypothetical protein